MVLLKMNMVKLKRYMESPNISLVVPKSMMVDLKSIETTLFIIQKRSDGLMEYPFS